MNQTTCIPTAAMRSRATALFAVIAATSLSAFAETKDWQNPELTGVNNLTPHAAMVICPDCVKPGDSGNKVDVRWEALTNKKGVGLLAIGAPLLSVNALTYTAEDMTIALHPHQLPHRDIMVLNLDWKSQGLGGDNSWGAWPHEPYLIPCVARGHSFHLRPIAVGADLATLERAVSTKY